MGREAGAGSSQPIDGGTDEKDGELITPSLQSHGEAVVAEGNVPALTADVAHEQEQGVPVEPARFCEYLFDDAEGGDVALEVAGDGQIEDSGSQ